MSYADVNGNYRSLMESAFYEDHEGWQFEGGAANGSIEVEDDRLRVNVKTQWNGAVFNVGEDFSVGDQVELNIDIDKGDTDVVRVFLIERDQNNNLLGYYMLNANAQTESYAYSHTIVAGPRLALKIDKSNTNLGVATHFYVDNVFASTGELEIVEENNYYPFGLKHKGYNYNINGVDHPYGFGGKEEQNEFNNTLQWLDFGARNYDPALGRWMNIDPLAEKYVNMSPYNYGANNSIIFFDPNGEDVYLFYAVKGYSEEEDSMFWQAALTAAVDFLNSDEMGADDMFMARQVEDIADLKGDVEDAVSKLSPVFGKTKEFGLWSHASLDGPVGSKSTSRNALDGKQMTMEGWGEINFNWKEKGAVAAFYGCRTGVDKTEGGDDSFVTRVSALGNFSNVTVFGQTSYSYPSRYTNVRESSKNQRDGDHDYPTYLVGGNSMRSWLGGMTLEAHKMRGSINGRTTLLLYQHGKKTEDND